MDFSRIVNSVDMATLQNAQIVIVGAGGSYNLIINLVRSGLGRLTVLDFDTVDESNIVRQGYDQSDIGSYKVAALEKKVMSINPDVQYKGVTKNFLDMTEDERDSIFRDADMFLFLTDSFRAQSFGNILALKYNKPSLWAGWYTLSRTSEIFFQVPNYTPACFRCAVSPRYKANEAQEVIINSNANTIFHSELLDSFIGMLTLAIVHRDFEGEDKESSVLYKSLLDKDGVLRYNLLQFKVHPRGGNPLFEEAYSHLGKTAQFFSPLWQRIDPEILPHYNEECPDCCGGLNELVNKT